MRMRFALLMCVGLSAPLLAQETSPENQSSTEMTEWIKSNSSSAATHSDSSLEVHADRPSPDQVDGIYQINAENGPFLCTVSLTSSPSFGGYAANTSTGCPDLWNVTRWDFHVGSLVLTNNRGDIFASFRSREPGLWVGHAAASGQRLSMSP